MVNVTPPAPDGIARNEQAVLFAVQVPASAALRIAFLASCAPAVLYKTNRKKILREIFVHSLSFVLMFFLSSCHFPVRAIAKGQYHIRSPACDCRSPYRSRGIADYGKLTLGVN